MSAIHLTTKLLDAIATAGTRQEYRDTVVRGLALRLAFDGTKTWSFRYRTPTGERRRLHLGRYPDVSLKKVRLRANAVRIQVADGKDPAQATQIVRAAVLAPQDTVARLAAEYLTQHAKKYKRSWRADERMLNAEILPAWQHRLVRDLKRRDVRELLEAIADRGAPYTANLCLAIVRKMLNFAIGRDWVEANVASLIAKPGVERSRDRVLTEEEIRQVWTALEDEWPILRALLKLRLVTAQRGGELAQIQWSYITGDWLTLPGTITKNKQAHRVPLTKTAHAILESVPRLAHCPWVFPGRTDAQPLAVGSQAAPRIIQRVLAADPAIATFDFRAHDLRRTAATYMAEAGIPPVDIARVLNHAHAAKGSASTQIYNRYAYDREKRIALETWERRLIAILAQKSQGTILPFVAENAVSSP